MERTEKKLTKALGRLKVGAFVAEVFLFVLF